jgi:RHS repeat-associated protein
MCENRSVGLPGWGELRTGARCALRPAIVLLAVAGALSVSGAGSSVQGAVSTHDVLTPFVQSALGARGRPRGGLREVASATSHVSSAGFTYGAHGSALTVASENGERGSQVDYARGEFAATSFGAEAVTLDGQSAEQLLTVRAKQGVHVWRWRLQSSLQARVSPSGSVGFFAGRTSRLADVEIRPVRIYDRLGRDVTPRGAHWDLQSHGRSRWLTLALDDRALPLPYTIDPIATRTPSASGVGASGMTVTVPATVEVGDLIVVHAAVVGGSGVSSIATSLSSGGSLTVLSAQNNAGTALAQKSFWKRASAADASATVTLTWSPVANAGAAEVIVVKGVATDGTIPQSGSGAFSSSIANSKVVTCPAISSGSFPKDNFALCLGAINQGNSWPASPSPWSIITSRANGASLSIGSYGDLCATTGGCSVGATSITTTGSNGHGQLANDLDVPPDTAMPSADTIAINKGSNPGVQYFNAATATYYFGVIPSATSFNFTATPTDSGSGPDHVAFPNVSATTGWAGDSGGTVNYQAGDTYVSSTYTITTSPNTPANATINATDNNSNTRPTTIAFVHDTTAPPAPAAPTLTAGFYSTASVPVTGVDSSDAGSGTNAAAGTMWRASATLNGDGTCGSFGSFTALSGWTSGVQHSDTTVTNGHCYEYEWQTVDNVANGSILATPSGIAKVAISGPPIPDSPPTVSGSAAQDATLTTSNGTWADNPTSYSYQWQRCSAYSATTESLGPNAYWRLGEASGTTAADAAGYGNAGTYSASGVTLGGAPATGSASNEVDTSASFASGGKVSVPSLADWNPRSALTVEAWVSPSNTGSATFVSKGSSASTLSFALAGNGNPSNVPLFQVRVGGVLGTIPGSSALPTGSWTFLVGTFDGSQLRLYVNGVSQGAANVSGPIDNALAAFALGNNYDSNFSGGLDEVAVFDKVLTGAQITSQYAAVNQGCSNIAGATSQNYTLTGADVASHVRVTVTASNANGSGSASSSASAMVSSGIPDVVTPPAVTGNPTFGSTVSAANGSWTHSPTSYGYQWQRCSVYSSTTTSYGPIGYWRLGDLIPSTAAADGSGYGNGGSYSASGVTLGGASAVGAGNGEVDTGASFTGGGKVSVPALSDWNPGSALTVEAWVAPSNQNAATFVSKGSSASTLSFALVSSGGPSSGPAFQVHVAGQVYSSGAGAPFPASGWTFLVGTWDGSMIHVYVNGAGIGGAFPPPGPIDNAVAPFALGNNFDSNFSGGLDEVAVFDRVLTGTEIAAQYAAVNQGCSNIAGATSQNYKLTGADVGSRVRVIVTASNADGSNKATAESAAVTGVTKIMKAEERGTNPAYPGACTCKKLGVDPVNTATGDFHDTTTEAPVASYGLPLNFARSYDSSLAQDQATGAAPLGRLGYGWTDNWAMSLAASGNSATIVQAGGATVDFVAPVSGACVAPYVGPGTAGSYCALPGVTASLSFDSASSTYTFITHPYRSYTFNSSGQLTGESGPGAAATTLTYNTPAPGSGACPAGASKCNTVTAPSGRKLVLALNASSQITSVIDPLGRAWSYSYCVPPSSSCSSGDLVSVADPLGKVTSYTYDAGNANSALRHDLLTTTKPNGQPGGPNAGAKLTNTYDTAGRVTAQTDPGGYQSTIDYSHIDSSGVSGYTLVTDRNGNVTQYVFDGSALTKRVVGYGSSSPATWAYTIDPATLLTTATTDPNSHTTTVTYDSRGNLLTSTDPLSHTTSYAYNTFDEPTCATSPLAAAGCASLTPPAAVTAGAATVSPPATAPPKYVGYSEYDTNGNPVWATAGDYQPGAGSPSQSRTSYSLYNGQTLTTTPSVSCSASAPSATLPCATVDPKGVATQLGYNASGDLTSSSTPDGNTGGELATTGYSYDGDGEQLTVTAPNGNLTGATAAVYTTTVSYDNDGRPQQQTVSQTGGTITARVTSYGYDANGNRTSVTDPRNQTTGKTTSYSYTANDQLALVTDPDGHKTLTCYDGEGTTTQTVPPVGVAANSLTPSSCPTSFPSGYGSRLAADATSTTYDALGNAVTTTTPAPAGQSGYETTTRTFDPAGRLTSLTAPPTSTTVGAPNQTTNYSYDNADQLTAETVGALTTSASTTVYCYDPNGDSTATVAPDGNTSSLTICGTNSPWQTSSAYQTGYSFDSLRQLVSTTRPATAAAPSGQTTSYAYDPAGNQTSSTDPNSVTTTTTYTPLDQVASVSYSGSAAHSVSYAYDANGNRTSMSDASGSSSYQYNPFNELASHTNGANQVVGYGYDSDGNTTAITYPLGSPSWATTNTIGYAYDDASLLTTVTDFSGQTFTIANTADGLPNSISLGGSGDTIATSYDQTDSPSQINLNNSGGTLLGFGYTNTPAGTTAEETRTPTSSASPRDYDFDPQGRIKQMTVHAGTPTTYGFDASSNPTTLPTAASASYDNASEVTSSTLASTTTSYSYDPAGNRTQTSIGGVTQTSGSYNGADELTGYTNSVASMSAATYDGDGLRTASTNTIAGGSPVTQNYLWDTTTTVPQLLTDTNNAYVYANSSTPLEQINLTTGTPTYLLADQLGSIRATISASGAISATTNYDAWGNPDTTGGLTSATPYGYASSYTDPTGLTYLIHRYYDPYTGQFANLDPLLDDTAQPYAYANDDPINESDPVGLCAGIPFTGPCPGMGVASDVAHFAYKHSGTISSVTGGLAAVAYLSCPITVGVGCAVGGGLSIVSAVAGGANAYRSCSQRWVSERCAVAGAGFALSVAASGYGTRLATAGRQFENVSSVRGYMFGASAAANNLRRRALIFSASNAITTTGGELYSWAFGQGSPLASEWCPY